MTSAHDHTRDPCPWVILSDFGGAFAMGAIGGTIWHGIKGARNSPRGDRLISSLSSIKARAPVVGGNFGVWGGLFSTFDCGIKGIRGKEDPWNVILSGFATGGALAMRAGPAAMAVSSLQCGILLSVIEGVGVLFGRMAGEATRPMLPMYPDPNDPSKMINPNDPSARLQQQQPPSSSSSSPPPGTAGSGGSVGPTTAALQQQQQQQQGERTMPA